VALAMAGKVDYNQKDAYNWGEEESLYKKEQRYAFYV
jgi:hypothetical protein